MAESVIRTGIGRKGTDRGDAWLEMERPDRSEALLAGIMKQQMTLCQHVKRLLAVVENGLAGSVRQELARLAAKRTAYIEQVHSAIEDFSKEYGEIPLRVRKKLFYTIQSAYIKGFDPSAVRVAPYNRRLNPNQAACGIDWGYGWGDPDFSYTPKMTKEGIRLRLLNLTPCGKGTQTRKEWADYVAKMHRKSRKNRRAKAAMEKK